MAWFEVDIFNKSIEVDLHEYSHSTAIAVSVDRGSKNHRFDGGYLLLALRQNPAPVNSDWKEMPFHEY